MESPVRRFPGPALAALAFLLTVAGTFLPLFRIDEPAGTDASSGMIRLVQSAWGATYSFPGQDEVSAPTAPIGVSLVLASATLLAAAVLGFRQAATRRPGAAASRTTLGGAAFLAGAVCTIVLLGMRSLLDAGRARAETTAQTGTWLLVAAVLAAAVAAVLSFRGSSREGRADWADPAAAYADTETPPSGVVITVLPPEGD